MLTEHNCPHAGNIGALMKTVERLEGAIDGNGSKGLLKDVTINKTEISEMNKDLGSMATSLLALAKSQIEQDAIEKSKVESSDKRSNAVKMVGVLISIVIGSAAVLKIVLDFVAKMNV